MPYASNEDLPPPVRDHLPQHAQDIYREAFNHAYAAHWNDPRREEADLHWMHRASFPLLMQDAAGHGRKLQSPNSLRAVPCP